MKKMLKNKKGFSLIELLIVIAIMGVLAVIAFSMFSGVLSNSKKNADDRQAGNIQKALVAYMVDSNDPELKNLKNGATVVGTSAKTEDLVLALQAKQTLPDGKTLEGYLNPKTGTNPSTADFHPQWTGNGWYYVEIYKERLNASVKAVPSSDSAHANQIVFK